MTPYILLFVLATICFTRFAMLAKFFLSLVPPSFASDCGKLASESAYERYITMGRASPFY
jgi:hypothetical protein